jgi:GGDEF domain-containing protein
VPEKADPANPTKPTRPRRSRKFVLPEHHHDELEDDRTAEHIEAFLDGPVAPPRRIAATEERVRRPIELDTRPDWMTAFRHEAARHARYGRPASVLLIELRGQLSAGANDRVAQVVGEAIRAEARETDRAVRLGARSFRILLPETGGRAAKTLVERLGRAVESRANGQAPDVDLRMEVATASRTGTLEQALADGEARIVGSSATPAATSIPVPSATNGTNGPR